MCITGPRGEVMRYDKAVGLCGFSLRQEPRRVVLIENLTGRERDLTAPEANLWADACQRLNKDAKLDDESR
jgi:hypothetical protein